MSAGRTVSLPFPLPFPRRVVSKRVGVPGIVIEIVNPETPLDAAKDALDVYSALLELPVETRRALQLLIAESAESFVGMKRKPAPVAKGPIGKVRR
jgi:hypothetical protein